jgi:predicted nucleic acid-binding protein
MAVVVVTNVVSYLFKEDTRAKLYEPHLVEIPKFISFMTFAELRHWKLQNNWGKKKITKFEEFLSDFGVIHSDEELCEIWANIKTDAHKKGNPIDTADAWVASVAILFDIPLVTHNRKHFENVEGLKIISEA